MPVGDKVKITARSLYLHGRIGQIIKCVSDTHYRILLDDGCVYLFHKSNFELVKQAPKAIVIMDEIQQLKCKLCGGEGRLLMLNDYVDCEYQNAKR